MYDPYNRPSLKDTKDLLLLPNEVDHLNENTVHNKRI